MLLDVSPEFDLLFLSIFLLCSDVIIHQICTKYSRFSVLKIDDFHLLVFVKKLFKKNDEEANQTN